MRPKLLYQLHLTLAIIEVGDPSSQESTIQSPQAPTKALACSRLLMVLIELGSCRVKADYIPCLHGNISRICYR